MTGVFTKRSEGGRGDERYRGDDGVKRSGRMGQGVEEET